MKNNILLEIQQRQEKYFARLPDLHNEFSDYCLKNVSDKMMPSELGITFIEKKIKGIQTLQPLSDLIIFIGHIREVAAAFLELFPTTSAAIKHITDLDVLEKEILTKIEKLK